MKQFMSIKETCNYTGLSQCYLRHGCWEGTVPYVKSGVKYLINVPVLLERLGENYSRDFGKTQSQSC